MPMSTEFTAVEVRQTVRAANPEQQHTETVVLHFDPPTSDFIFPSADIEVIVLPDNWGSMKLGKRYRITIEEIRAKRKVEEVVEEIAGELDRDGAETVGPVELIEVVQQPGGVVVYSGPEPVPSELLEPGVTYQARRIVDGLSSGWADLEVVEPEVS